MRTPTGPVAAVVLACCLSAWAQTTQGFLAGSAIDSITAQPIPQARVLCRNIQEGLRLPALTDAGGRFAYAALSPGPYAVLVEADGYQSQELHLLEMPVAGRLELVFRLRPGNDVWEARQYQSYVMPGSQQTLTFYGPDLDTSRIASFEANRGTAINLDTSISTVVDSRTIAELPLVGRDVYSVLVLLPGVTADLATARGLGFSVGGQRPSSSNFLLDGLENNDLLVTGPLGRIAPESVAEYRISTNNFSAEYGRTGGFLANAITRTGSNSWHGLGYFYLKNDKLDGNGFQENVQGIRRPVLQELQPGVSAAGRILRDRLFATANLELLRFRSHSDPQTFALPAAGFIAASNAASDGGRLLREYPAAAVPTGPTDAGLMSIAPPAGLDQALALARIDYLPGSGRHRLFARANISREREPDLVFNPFPQFSSPYHQGAVGAGVGWTWQKNATLTQEVHVGRTGNSARYDRPHAEVPQLFLDSNNTGNQLSYANTPYVVSLPGSASSLNYRNLARNWEIVDNWSWNQGRHNWKFGGGLLWRTIDSAFTADRDGNYGFHDLTAFAADQPFDLYVSYDRTGAGYSPVPYNRSYRYGQFDGFAQDAFRATGRLTVNYGVRYDFLGAPVNTGPAKDSLLELGLGSGLSARLMTVHYQTPGAGNQQLFASDKRNWAVRAGLAYAVTGSARTLLRLSYGIYYDRPFDNLWQIVTLNRQVEGHSSFDGPVTFLAPPLAVAAQGTFMSAPYHPPLLFQPGLRNPMVQNSFAGLQQRLSESATLDLNARASRGRRLWTGDVINRDGAGNPDPNLQGIYYRGNQGKADYYGVTSAVRFRGVRWNGQAAYTWSHAIDNQSDALSGVFADYNLSNEASKPDFTALPAFAGQGDSQADRANADFDQRHNLVFYGIYEIPPVRQQTRARALLRGWRVSGLGAIRSGLPFSVYAFPMGGGTGPPVLNQRANLLDPALVTPHPAPEIAGGKILLNAAAFGYPGLTAIGTSGRNAFAGPGLVSADLSVARQFSIRRLGDAVRVTLRADFYNAFNHANLNNPQSYLTGLDGSHFGQALYGRSEQASGLPVLAPLNETSRQVQVFLRFAF